MLRSPEVLLTGSVGEKGANRYHDVLAIQQLIDDHLPHELRRLDENGLCDPVMIGTIAELQRIYRIVPTPDGRIDPHGPTLRALNHAERVVKRTAAPQSPLPVQTLPSMAPAPNLVKANAPAPAKAAPTTHPATLSAAHAAHHKNAHALPAEVIAGAQRAQQRWDIPASITIAQWAWESTWGHAMPRGSNNPFGIKARAGDKFVKAWTHETIHHQSVRKLLNFRAFNSQEEAFDWHGRMLATFRPYRPALPMRHDPDRYAHALTHVYASDDDYGRHICEMMRENDLYRFNQ